MSVNRRLRSVDGRFASIDRRLGFLSARLYFQPMDGAEREADIFACTDSGVSAQNKKTGEEVYARRYSFKVNRSWLEANANLDGIWRIAPGGGVKLKATIEDQSVNDADTFGLLSFRIDQSIELPSFEIP